ncbi:MAG: NADH-quinone oxidoreductase subunit C [Kiritimatiellae bacterium]|nr:NADH-quinone oxidoreductase subunit C [Kiritimatiellia bacterium]
MNPPKPWVPEPRTALPSPVPSPDDLLAALKEAAGADFLDGATRSFTEGGTPEKPAPAYQQVWLRVNRDALHDVVARLVAIAFPHFVVIAATDVGDAIELPYIFRVLSGPEYAEVLVSVTAVLPKSDPSVDTITDLIPGALLSEREKQEMMGVKVNHIPDPRRMFLPEDFPEGVYPWRRDETGIPAEGIHSLWSFNRPPIPPPPAPVASAAPATQPTVPVP